MSIDPKIVELTVDVLKKKLKKLYGTTLWSGNEKD